MLKFAEDLLKYVPKTPQNYPNITDFGTWEKQPKTAKSPVDKRFRRLARGFLKVILLLS